MVAEEIDTFSDNMIVRESEMENTCYFSQEPHFRLLNFSRQRQFYIPLPWIHFRMEVFQNSWNRNPTWHLWSVFASPLSLDDSRAASCVPLPNFYRDRPCMSDRSGLPDQIVTRFWQEEFNREGRLAWHRVWQTLTFKAGAEKRTERAKILSYWETLTLDEVLRLPWPQNYLLD